jgi:hypothetical protein
VFQFVFPYFRGFVAITHRLLPLFCVCFFLGVTWFDLGAGLNIPAIVWHDSPVLQASAGFSIAALFAYLWLLTYIIDARFHPEFIRDAVRRTRRSLATRLMTLLLPRSESPGNPPAEDSPEAGYNEGGDGLRWYLGATYVPCALLLMLPAFFNLDSTKPFIHFTDPNSTPAGKAVISDHWPFVCGVLATFLWVRLVAGIGNLIRRRTVKSDGRKGMVQKFWLQSIAFFLCFFLGLLFAVFAYLVNRDLWQPPPIVAVCMLFGMLAAVNAAMWFHLKIGAIPVLFGILAWAIYCNQGDYRLRFPHLEPEYAAITDLEDHEEPVTDLKDIEVQDGSKAKAQREESERVMRMVANMFVQMRPERKLEDVVDDFKNKKGFAEPENYGKLLETYNRFTSTLNATERQALEKWKAQFAPENLPKKEAAPRPVMIVVTATGGANRSGLWTSKVLSELHKQFPNFPKHVRIIAGASGGMVGASYYVGSVQDDGSLQEGFQPEDVAQDFLTPIINSLVFREMPLLMIPLGHYDRDRGEMLDRAMEGEVPGIDPGIRKRLHNSFSKSFLDWKQGEDEGWRPSMIFSPMIVEDGRRLLISNRHIPTMTVNRGDFLLPNRPTFGDENAAPKAETTTRVAANSGKGPNRRRKQGDGNEDVYSRPAVEFFRLFPESRGRFHVSTAARMNATFPFVSPAVSLPTAGPRRVVDAGYFDNTGVSIASAWLYLHREWIARNTSGVIVVQIRDFASHQENRNVSFPREAGGSYLPGVTGVLSAVDHARSSSANYRNDAELQQLHEFFREFYKANAALAPKSGAEGFFTTVVFERYTDVGMNWYLSNSDKADILASWDRGKDNYNPASLKKMKDWWQSRNK